MFPDPRSVIIALLLCLSCIVAGARTPAQQVKPRDLNKEMEAARAVQGTLLPPESAMGILAGEVNGIPVRLGDLLEEVVFLYASPMIEVLGRQKAMALEAAGRGIRVGEMAFRRAVSDFIETNGRGRSLVETLRAQRIFFQRFKRLMHLNAAVAAMVRADTGTPAGKSPGEEAGRTWARKVQGRHIVETDPARLERGTFATISVEGSLRNYLKNHLSGATPLEIVAGRAPSRIRFAVALVDGGRAFFETDDVGVVVYASAKARPETRALSQVFPGWKAGTFRLQKPSRSHPDLARVIPKGKRFPAFVIPTGRVRLEAALKGRELLAARIPDLKLRHLDEALESRGRYVAALAAMKERGIKISDTRVARRIEEEREKYRGSEFSWERAIQLVGRNVYLETRRFRVADGVNQIVESDVGDVVLKAYYEAHIEHFGRATVTASHILVSEADPATGRVDFDRARSRIKEVYKKLKAGADFIDMVQQYSQDAASRDRGGDVGMFTLVSAYDPEFCRLAFALEENEITPPVRTRQGYHIIYCRKRTPPDREAYPFEKVKDIVRQDRQEDLQRRWLEEHVYRPLKIVNRVEEATKGFMGLKKRSI